MTSRFAMTTAATLAAMMISVPALAQDGPRKPAPTKPSTSRVPKSRVPKSQPAETPPTAKDDVQEPSAEVDAGDDIAEKPPSDDAAQENELGAEVEETEPETTDADQDASEAEDIEAPESDEDELDVSDETPSAEEPATKRKRRRAPPTTSRPSSWRSAPYELEYVDGMDIPDGYTKVDCTRKGLVIAGAVTLGVGWLVAATAAVAASDEEGGCYGGGYVAYEGEGDRGFGCVQGSEPEDFAPLYIPVVGPFIAMGTLEHAGGDVRAALLLDGVVQVGGAAMLIAGLAAKKTVLLRTKHATMGVAPGPGSIHLHGSF